MRKARTKDLAPAPCLSLSQPYASESCSPAESHCFSGCKVKGMGHLAVSKSLNKIPPRKMTHRDIPRKNTTQFDLYAYFSGCKFKGTATLGRFQIFEQKIHHAICPIDLHFTAFAASLFKPILMHHVTAPFPVEVLHLLVRAPHKPVHAALVGASPVFLTWPHIPFTDRKSVV